MYQVKLTGQAITVFFAVTLLASGVAAAEPMTADNGNIQLPELDCIIEPSEVVDVGSAVPGVVESILADRNDQIEKGMVIARLESSVERAALELTRERANQNTAIEQRQEGARFSHLTQNRNSSLLQTAAISKHDLDTVVSETRIAELQVRQELDNKRIAELELARAEAVLDRRTIRSPVDGVVVDRFKAAGEYIENEPVMRVAQLDPLHVEVIVSTDYLGRIKPGMQAQVTPVIPEADTYLATVERVDRVSDAASGTYGVRLNLGNPGYLIPAGLRCRLGFIQYAESAAAEAVEITQAPAAAEVPEIAAAAEAAEVTATAANPATAGTAIDVQTSEVLEVERVAEVSEARAENGMTAKAPEITQAPAVAAVPEIAVATEAAATAAIAETTKELQTAEVRVPDLPAGPSVTGPTEQPAAVVATAAVAEPALSVQPSTPVAEAPPVGKETEPGSCHTVGPFTSEKVAKRWLDGLQEVSENLTLRDETTVIEEGYIVLASVEPDPQSIEKLLDRLDRAGVTDRYHFRSGVRRGSVSLGLYNNHDIALKRQEELAEKGFASAVTPRSVSNKHYWWLDLSLPAGADLPKWINQLPASASAKPAVCHAQLAQR